MDATDWDARYAESERVWSLVLRDASIYGGYEQKTSREIPLVRLTRA